MQLLSPEEIKEDKKIMIEESSNRSRALAIEEVKINRELNLLKTRAEIDRNYVKKETDEFIATQQERKDILIREITSLEDQRKELLKPIFEIENKAKEVLKDAENQLLEVKEAKLLVENNRENNLILAEKLQEKQESLNEQERDLINRQEKLNKEEEHLKNSFNTLNQKWSDYNLEILILNKKIRENKIIENKLNERQKALDITQNEQEKRVQEIKELDIVVRDKYAALATAVEHIETKYNTKI